MEYRTKDIDEAAFLWTQPGVEFAGEDRSGRTVFFKFVAGASAASADLEAMITSFHSKKTLVEPKAYSQRQQDVRDILHRVRRSAQVA